MARARNIKPSFFKNEDLAELDPYARLLFIGLWCLADREGLLEDRPKRIKGELFPYEDVDVDKHLQALHNKGFIIRYQVDGQRYICIPKFLQHQNPHHREAKSQIPKPNLDAAKTEGEQEKEVTDDKETQGEDLPRESLGLDQEKTEESPADSPFLIPDSLNLIPESPPPIHMEPSMDVVVVGGRPLHVSKSALDLYQHYFAFEPTPKALELLNSYLDEGMQPDAIAWAMRDAAEKGKTWAYARGTLQNLFARGVRTAEQAERADQEFRQRNVIPMRPKVIADKLPESVQRQMERERQGEQQPAKKVRLVDDPEFRAMLESFPKAEGRR